MAEEAGFQIGKRFYPFPSSFRLGDPVLVRDVTGLDWGEFVERLPGEEEEIAGIDDSDAIVLLGLVAVAVWQGNPTWRRDKASRYAQMLNMDDVQPVGSDDGDEEEGDGSPPEMTSGETLSETSLETSASVDTHSDESSRNSSGTPVSVIGSPV